MVADQTLISKLSVYNGQPAIFTIDPAPEDAELPFIVISGLVSDSPYDTKLEVGRDITRDIRCYTPASGSIALLEEISEEVRRLFHRQKLQIEGYSNIITSCTGQAIATEYGDAYGHIITVRIIIQEVI